MLSRSTSTKLALLIKTFAEAELQAEVVRQVLCEKSFFEVHTAFRRVSQLSSSINSQHLLSFLRENDIKISKQDAYYLIRLYDLNGDGSLSYSEFVNAVLTKSNPELRKEVSSRKPYAIQEDEGLPYQIEHAIARIFEEELDSYRNCEILRQDLAVHENFSPMNAFKAIDIEDNGYIVPEQIVKFVESANEPIEESHITAFMSRIDKNADGIIRYSEFLELFYSSEVVYDEEEQPQISPKKRSIVSSPQKADKEIKDTYSTPRKQYLSPTKVMNISTVESLYSPTSTKASFANTTVYKTPTRISPAKAVYEEPNLIAQSNRTPSSNLAVNFTPRKDSPMKPKEEIELVKALKEMIEHIRALEISKNTLAMMKDFNSYNAFSIFDAEKKGVINSRQLEQGFECLDLHFTKADVALLMKKLDTDLDGQLKFGDFNNAITPKSAEFAKLMGSREPYYISELENVFEAFTEETLEVFRSFLKALVEEETLCESIRQRLVKRKAFNLHDAFNALDRYNKSFITAEEFKEILEENGCFFSQKDVNTLVERYSKASKGKVSYYDFIREMTPKSVEKY